MNEVNVKLKWFLMYLEFEDGDVVIDFCILLFCEFLLLDVGFCCCVEEERFDGGLFSFYRKKIS